MVDPEFVSGVLLVVAIAMTAGPFTYIVVSISQYWSGHWIGWEKGWKSGCDFANAEFEMNMLAKYEIDQLVVGLHQNVTEMPKLHVDSPYYMAAGLFLFHRRRAPDRRRKRPACRPVHPAPAAAR